MITTVTLNPAADRELTVPAMAFDTVLRATAFQVDCGGKGFNVSRMLMALGARSRALAFAGGKAGELLHQELERLGIAAEFVWIDGETRTNVSVVTEAHDRYLKVNEPGPTVPAAAREALLARVGALATAGTWWVLAGSLPPGVPDSFYADLIAVIQGQGGQAILDASGEALRAGCAAGPFLAKPNTAELQALTGLPVSTPDELVRAAEAVRALGVHHVVVSLGKDGALLVDETGAWLAGSPTIEERNPIGAGDSMVGGLVWRLSLGESLRDALPWGLACGAATASQDGTAVGSRDQVAALVAAARIQELA